jgi:hypothetical protein
VAANGGDRRYHFLRGKGKACYGKYRGICGNLPNDAGWYSKLRAAVDWNLIEGGGARWRKDLA